MPWENHEKTIIFKEFSKETGANDIPYYPKRFRDDKILLNKYRQKARNSQISLIPWAGWPLIVIWIWMM